MIVWIVEILFQSTCGWIGHHLLRVVTFGRIAPPWGRDSESAVAEWVGLLAVAATASALALVLFT